MHNLTTLVDNFQLMFLIGAAILAMSTYTIIRRAVTLRRW